MAGNASLYRAKKKKDDEFYTRIEDVRAELRHYREQFKDKRVYLPCDDPARSAFWQYFAQEYESLGLAELAATWYVPGGESQLTKLGKNGKIVHTQLIGDGDFQSEECQNIMAASDIIVTNPPFSLMRDFMGQLVELRKRFLIISQLNAVFNKEQTRHLLEGRFWLGVTHPKQFIRPDGSIKTLGFTVWATNLPHERRSEPLPLTARYDPAVNLSFDNLDAINVDKVNEIPCDYYGVMAVPFTFIERYCPAQFEIVGTTTSADFFERRKKYTGVLRHNIDGTTTKQHIAVNNLGTIGLDKPPAGAIYCTAENSDKYLITPYNRILIRRKTEKRPPTAQNSQGGR